MAINKFNFIDFIMTQIRQISSTLIIALLFLLPIFFVPGGFLSIGVAKTSLLALGVVALVLVFLSEIWRKGEFGVPKHFFVLAVILLPIVYFVSAISSNPSSLSLFGYDFEVGTFGYILLSSVLLIVVSALFTETSKFFHALLALFASFSLIALFLLIKMISGGAPVWGIFNGITANTIGRWTDLASTLGLLSLLSVLIIGIAPAKKSLRVFAFVMFVVSTALFAIINFSTAFIFTLITAILLFVYFMTVEKRFSATPAVATDTLYTPDPSMPAVPASPQGSTLSAGFIFKPTFLLSILGLISIIFLINPTISSTSGTLGDVVTGKFNVSNTEVRPSFSATLSISKAALSEEILLGSGPNTFSRDWLVHKPADINTTPFWGEAFPFGVGFVPTQVASTGVLGTVSWLIFFVFLVLLVIKVLANLPESRTMRFTLVSSLSALIYLWTASFLYTPSLTLLTLAFVFSGLFLAAARQAGIIGSRSIRLTRDTTTNIISVVLIIVVGLGAIFLGFVAVEKATSAFYFEKAIQLSNQTGASLDDIESALTKATQFSPADVHYSALSRVYFAKAQTIAASTEGTPEENLAIFQDAISKSISSAREAINLNSGSYTNWIALGSIYSYLVPAPLSVAGAYENATIAYGEAKSKNPLNPEVALFVARLEFNNGDVDAARSAIRESLALKEDYADAHLTLAQLEIQAGNLKEAIVSAEQVARLIPGNPSIYFELGLLKYSDKDYLGAGEALALALTVAPDYANAQYYMGLTLAQIGRLDDALKQFEVLALSNPDSVEVQQIIKDLKAGSDSFLDSLAQ